MRAYQLPKIAAGNDELVEVDRPMPKPLYRQVLVKVMACSLNYRDLLIARGGYHLPMRETRSRGGRSGIFLKLPLPGSRPVAR